MEKNFDNLTRAQRRLRYSICVDIDASIEMGATLEEAIEWFSSEECAETYELEDGIADSGEVLIEVVAEVVKEHYSK